MNKALIKELINCNKVVSVGPTIEYPDSQNHYCLRSECKYKSEDGKFNFEVFMRRHSEIPSIFSIGLVYVDPRNENEKVNLVRCNGKHFHRNKVINKKAFDNYHIHIANEKQLDQTRSFDAIEAEYTNFQSAVTTFCNFCNIDEVTLSSDALKFNYNAHGTTGAREGYDYERTC